MNSNRQRFVRFGIWGIGLIVGSGLMCFGGNIDQGNCAFALDKNSAKTAIGAQSESQIDPGPLVSFIRTMGTFDNSPKGDKTRLKARYQDLQRLTPGFIATTKAVVRELKAKGYWAKVDEFLYAEAAKDRLPATLMEEVKSVGGPKVILENIDRFIAEDLKNRLQRTTASNQGSFINNFKFTGTAYAGTGCSIGAWGANGIMKVFGWLVSKDYSSDIQAANLQYCM